MRHSDNRSCKIAVLPEGLMNAHLAAMNFMLPMQRRLEEQGYGILQLPPAEAPREAIEIAVRFVVDQVQDYLKNSYEVVEVTTGSGPDEVSRVFREVCRSRGLTVASLPL